MTKAAGTQIVQPSLKEKLLLNRQYHCQNATKHAAAPSCYVQLEAKSNMRLHLCNLVLGRYSSNFVNYDKTLTIFIIVMWSTDSLRREGSSSLLFKLHSHDSTDYCSTPQHIQQMQ